ncbi:hypothetical protein BD769DRAFT_1774202 [Suillus cothurnatus]|nr:hypothetical protein BD769DRAFT_1774202 [Suillus cothurnatus]
MLENRASQASSSSNLITLIPDMPQTRAKTTASTHTHSIPSSSPAPATNSSPTRATPYTRSRGPAAASEPINSTSTAQPRVRTPLTIRLPRASIAGHATTLSITNNASTSSLAASAPAAGINVSAGAPIPTSSIRTPIPAPIPPVRTPPPSTSNVSQSTSTTPPRPPPSAPMLATSAPKSTPASSARVPAPPIFTLSHHPHHLQIIPIAQSVALANTSVSTSPRCPTPPPTSSHASLSTSTTLRPIQPMLATASEQQIASRQAPQAQYPTLSSAGALPSPASADELEAEKMKERKRINARNSRARRKLAMRNEAAKDNGSMSSVEPGPLLGSRIQPSVDPTPGPGDFMLCLPDPNPPVGSYYSTTFHEILTKADRNSGSSDGASITHPHFEPDRHSNFDFDAAMPPALFPLTKARDFRDACTMTDLSPDLPKKATATTHPRTSPRFATNPLQFINKAFLLIVPDPSSTLGRLVLCKVLEYRVSSAGHRFLVQFWGDKKASEMGVDKMMEVLEGGYEIDPPPAGPSAGPQGVGLAGRVFGALRSFTGF